MSLYILLYLIYVKVSGMYFYNIEWYPYPIFDLRSIEGLLGVGLAPLREGEFFVILTLFLIFSFLYYILLKLVDRLKGGRS